ncbi:hypothetical protein OT109_06120 [Phycisphaeraceae bacterium D3-23]
MPVDPNAEICPYCGNPHPAIRSPLGPAPQQKTPEDATGDVVVVALAAWVFAFCPFTCIVSIVCCYLIMQWHKDARHLNLAHFFIIGGAFVATAVSIFYMVAWLWPTP